MFVGEYCLLRKKRKFYGIFRHTSLSVSKQIFFEQLLESSLSLNTFEKIRIVKSASDLKTYKLYQLINVLASEMRQFGSEEFLKNQRDIKLLTEKSKTEWRDVEMYIEDNISGEEDLENYTPASIQHNMEKFVKGQREAVKLLSILLYYHRKANSIYKSDGVLPFKTPDPILISGATGTGKSYMLEVGCNILKLPYIHVDCSSLVSAGIVGNSIDDILKNLLRKTDYNVNLAESAIILFDEIDKLLAHHSGMSIYYQLLRAVEGAVIPISRDNEKKEEQLQDIKSISTHNMLFIFSGSFQKVHNDFDGNDSSDLINKIEKAGLPKELLGRINRIVVLNKLGRDDYKEILLEGKNSPLRQIKSMLQLNKTSITVDEPLIELILDKAENSPYGARALKKIVWEYYEPILYSAPEKENSSLN